MVQANYFDVLPIQDMTIPWHGDRTLVRIWFSGQESTLDMRLRLLGGPLSEFGIRIKIVLQRACEWWHLFRMWYWVSNGDFYGYSKTESETPNLTLTLVMFRNFATNSHAKTCEIKRWNHQSSASLVQMMVSRKSGVEAYRTSLTSFIHQKTKSTRKTHYFKNRVLYINYSYLQQVSTS